MSSRGRGRRTPAKHSPLRTTAGRGVRRSIDNDRRPETKDRLDLSHDKATQTALCKDQEELKPPRRPGYGTVGSEIALRVNRFSVKVGIRTIHHYDVKFDPEPRKTKDNMKIIQTLTEKFSAHLDGSKPAYDGKANLFTAKLLPFTNGEATFHVTLKLDPDDKEEKVFKVVIRWVTDVDVSQLKDVICGKTQSFPFDVLQALDIVIRMTPRLRFHPVGRSVFRPPDPLAGGSILLGQGREVWFGYHQSIRPSMWSLDLTVDVSATAFYEDCSVIGFLCKILNVRIEQFTGQISDRDRTKFLREIKGLKVTITHLGEQKRKYSVIDISHKSADSLVFPLVQEDNKTVDCTVAKYFYDRYAIKLKYPLLPCLQVAPKEKNRFLPIEVCRITPGQRCVKKLTEQQTAQMIRQTARSASEREREIKQIISEAAFSDDPYVKEFELTIDPTMCKVTGRVLPAPHLITGDNSVVAAERGVWNMREKTFFDGKTINCWALLSFASEREFNERTSRSFSTQLQKSSRMLNMPIVRGPSFIEYITSIDQLRTCFKMMMKKFAHDLQLIIVITSPRVREGYDELKLLGDLVHAIPTQCVQLKRAQECKPQVLANICLKVNAKLNGTNFVISPEHRSWVLKEPVIFLGADVTHPAQGERDDRFPSIAAVVGSMDRHACKYAGRLSIQKHRQEIISDLTDMVKGLLEEFRVCTAKAPKRIIFYRDGVSEGQFQQVLVDELRAIQAACKLIHPDYQPGITIIIVQKRHHTRFFPINPEDKVGGSGNIPAGTTVDREIVHPSEFDFFLCSHYGVQGTSRPTHYHLLWDDNGFTADELQLLTYQLCYLYVRCTRSVSLPAPVYYAHLAASRARCYQGSNAASAKPHQRLNHLKMMYFV